MLKPRKTAWSKKKYLDRKVRRMGRRLRLERVEDRCLLAGDIVDPSEAMDINGDGGVSAADALMVINQMDRERHGHADPSPKKMDINGDGKISASDAIRIINHLRRIFLGKRPPSSGPEFRSIDGSGNNKDHPEWGMAGTEFSRVVDHAYADGIGSPSGAARPSARLISNLVASQQGLILSHRGLSDMAWQWGQFIDHDIDLTGEGHSESLPIAVPEGDVHFDPAGTGIAEIDFMRSAVAPGTGHQNGDKPRAQINEITSFIDASMIYGADAERASALRAFSGGRLKVSEGDLLPHNEFGLPNAGGNGEELFLAGDIRANEQVGLTSLHTLWVREHNRIADEMAAKNPFFRDEIIYQRARERVIAQIQAITFNEYLPAVLGPNAVSVYEGYDSSTDPSISNLFATAAFRFGHTQLSGELERLADDGTVIDAGHMALRDAFFNPDAIMSDGIDCVLLGLATGVAQDIDTRIIDDVRNFLFGPPGAGGFDLASLNIQRGRDHGLPNYNAVRLQLGLEPVTSFSDITSDAELAEALEEAYGSVQRIDVWVGALAEDHVEGGSAGELLVHVISDQFERLREGDRFWYERLFSGQSLERLRETRLSDVILRNTDLTSVQANVFVSPEADPPSELIG